MGIIEEYFNAFLLTKPNYYNHVNAFKEYLVVKGAFQVEYLQGARTDTLIKALEYYIETREISSIAAAQVFSYAIQDLFLFLLYNQSIENIELKIQLTSPTHEEQSYRSMINTYISKHPQLVETEGFEMFDAVEIAKLIFDCDAVMFSENVQKKAIRMQKYFNKYRSALVIKLMLLTGIRYEILREIRLDEKIIKYGLLPINDVGINLTNTMKDQFEIYERILSAKDKTVNNRPFLFVEYDGRQLSKGTATTSDFLKKFTGRGDFNGLIKYRIVELIRQGVDERALRTVTGIGEKLYKECYDFIFDNSYIQRHVNSIIRKDKLYDLL